MRLWTTDPMARLLILVDAAALAVAAVLAGWTPVAVPAGLLLAFVLPGAALVGALVPGRGHSRLERCVLAVALSLAVLVLGGLGLHAVGVRLTQVVWAGLSGGTTVAAAVLAHLRTFREQPRKVERAGPVDRGRLARHLAPLVLALVLLGGAGWLSLATAARQTSATQVTALSIMDTAAASVTGSRLVTVVVSNQEATPTRYVLTVTGPDGYAVTLDLTASKDSAWRHSISVPTSDRVTANLYRSGDTTPFRTVYLHGSVVAQ